MASPREQKTDTFTQPLTSRDVEQGYLFFLGRPVESRHVCEDKVRGDRHNLILDFIASTEFGDRVAALTRSFRFDDYLFPNPYDPAVGAWLAESAPLTTETVRRVKAASDWTEALGAALADRRFQEAFGQDAGGLDLAALGEALLDARPRPSLRARLAAGLTPNDVTYGYLLFLGREPETLAVCEEKATKSCAGLLNDLLSSQEFADNIASTLKSGWTSGHVFLRAIPHDLRDWAVAFLPLEEGTADAVTNASSWQEILAGVFSDESFLFCFEKDDRAWALRDLAVALAAGPPTIEPGPAFASYAMVRSIYDASDALPYEADPSVIAFYLPQYHEVKENSEWWGEGFTEWTNVRKAVPNFKGHYQPHVPHAQDYYDLADPRVQRRQASLAKEYGVRAFCYYMYWFDGRRVLERPLDQMLADRSIDHEFCVCWANENWTRTWDGKADDILLGQVHSLESDRRFILDAIRYMRDPRYLRVAGKLVLLVYRVDLLPDCRRTAQIWREEVRRAGLGELHLCAVQFYGVTDPRPWGFDAAVEFPPHGWLVQDNLPDTPPVLTNEAFEGHIFDYAKSVNWALNKEIPDYLWYRGAFPGWDNTARRQHTPHIFANSNAFEFERWMTEILRQACIMNEPEHQLVFVNAWNEWGEGAHLEPDEGSGMLNLMALHSALSTARSQAWPLAVLRRLRQPGNYADRQHDELRLLNYLRGQEQAARGLAERLRRTGANPFPAG